MCAKEGGAVRTHPFPGVTCSLSSPPLSAIATGTTGWAPPGSGRCFLATFPICAISAPPSRVLLRRTDRRLPKSCQLPPLPSGAPPYCIPARLQSWVGASMFAMCQPEFPLHPQLGEAQGNSQQDAICCNKTDSPPDKNLNFMAEKSYDSNKNWSQPISKVPMPEEWEQWNCSGIKKVSENRTDLICRRKTKNCSRGISQSLKSDDNFLGLEEEKEGEEEDIRRPPEGAEIRSPEQETNCQVKVKVRGKPARSPRKDKTYSSTRWVDSPENDGTNVWKIPSVTDEEWTCNAKQKASCDDFDSSSSHSETFSPSLAEAFRNMQEKEKFKELEKQKYRTHLVMYRRLALLRWIRSLQQNVADQQNRLQESFDTILDNRKELIRHVQQDTVHSKTPT